MEEYLLPDIDSSLWKDAVEALVSLESTYGFETSSKCLSKIERPLGVENWLKSKRRKACPAPIDKMDANDMQFDTIIWWNSLQPTWRTLSLEGPEIGQGKWTREVKGDWGRLITPGVNGFYTVLACMRWWLVLEQKKDLDSNRASWNWKTVLSDIVWVIKTLAGKEPGEEPVSKKARTD
ncbi:hypothetical protein K435DRAFT_694942 [Dendrothele bispora CBS 962.96]|uniref:Uncharacterized protein n=1 Tax=Dendrothele bispora (strain CBS 962.96) TaxID=1314807 RepID=A0A4S8KXR1_DENBC|nr:hypothetical protein K435DRAFT_694942 [Dendrothele bispora CBS 962.96]